MRFSDRRGIRRFGTATYRWMKRSAGCYRSVGRPFSVVNLGLGDDRPMATENITHDLVFGDVAASEYSWTASVEERPPPVWAAFKALALALKSRRSFKWRDLTEHEVL